MRAGRAASRSDVADDIASAHRLSGLHREAAQVAIPRRQAKTMADLNQVAVIASVRGRLDGSIRCRVDGITFLRRDVDPLVKPWFAGERIAPPAESPGQPSMCRPD